MALRPMHHDDAPAVRDLMVEAFADLERRLGMPVSPPLPVGAGVLRVRHCARTDPGGAWVAEEDGRLTGAALAILREGIWGLSLLVVHPSYQSRGIGSALLRAALDYGAEARGGIILGSEDSRAMRAYARAGFALRPVVDASGIVRRRPPEPDGVRPGRWPTDRPLIDAVGRHVRTAAHGDDIGAFLAAGAELLVHDGGGFAVRREGDTKLLAATDTGIARALLEAVLRAAPEDGSSRHDFIAAGQDWAIETLLEAGLHIRPAGALFVRGDVGPMRPYLPSGSYL